MEENIFRQRSGIVMKSILTKMKEPITTAPVGQTRAGSAEAQPAGDSQLKAANCR